jgi:transglutaminase-like putative cysteine protease
VTDISRWILNILSIAVVLLSISRMSPDFLVEPILDAVLILMGIKLLEEKTFRDYMQIYAMCLFMLIGSGLVSFESIFIVYFSLMLFLLTVCLVLLAYYSHDPRIAISRPAITRIILCAIFICVLSIPSSAFFFLILPRTTYPLFSFLNMEKQARSGFSEDITLGGVSAIQEDQNVIFRAEMSRTSDSSLYWRGIVLDEFDGLSWRSSKEPILQPLEYPEGENVEQTIYLEPYGNRYLFALDKPVRIGQKHLQPFAGLVYSLNAELTQRTKYTALSIVSELLPEAAVDHEGYLQIPPDFSPKIKALAFELTVGKDRGRQIDSLYRFLKTGDFKYTLKGLPASSNALEEFLFQYRHGNCEYFASALAIMLRIAGVPSRLIGGYRGGYYNETGRYYMVLQKNAHVWVEAYIDNAGWLRIDPTPYTPDTGFSITESNLYIKVKLYLDTFNYYWNKLVINYDFSTQVVLLDRVVSKFRSPGIRVDTNWLTVVKYGLALGLPALIAWTIYWIARHRRSSGERLVLKFLARMARHGYRKGRAEGLEEFVSRVSDEQLRAQANEFVERFEGIFYRDRAFTKEDMEALEEQIARL